MTKYRLTITAKLSIISDPKKLFREIWTIVETFDPDVIGYYFKEYYPLKYKKMIIKRKMEKLGSFCFFRSYYRFHFVVNVDCKADDILNTVFKRLKKENATIWGYYQYHW